MVRQVLHGNLTEIAPSRPGTTWILLVLLAALVSSGIQPGLLGGGLTPNAPGTHPALRPALHTPSVPAPSNAQNTCPNSYYYGSTVKLTLQNTVDCAGSAGFSGNLEITFVSMAYQESNFCPGAIESGTGTCFAVGPGCSGTANAEGILQEGTAGQCPPAGGSFAVGSYSPSSCSTWSGSSSDWGGIYFNPLCSFQWALAYYNANGYGFWGSYLNAAYCQWAPIGFVGTGSEPCDSATGYPSGGENLSSLPWGTVCPGNVCPTSNSTSLAASDIVQDLTAGSTLSCGGTFAAGDSIQFTATVSGGTSPYTYAWAFGDGATGTGNPVTHVYTKAATGVNPLLTVTDAKGTTATSGSGCSFTVTAPPTLAISSFTASPASIPLGGTTYLNVSVTGGISPYVYAYSGLPTGCSSANTASLACAPSASGSYTVTVSVTDASSQTASKPVSFTVTSVTTGPAISSFTALPATIPLGGTAYLNVTASGGRAPFTYAYSGLPSPCASSNSSQITCTPGAAGTYTVMVTVTDMNSLSAYSNATFAVSPGSSGGPTISAFTVLPATIPLGGTTYVNTTAAGGSGTYTYAFAGLPAGTGCTAFSAAFTCVPTTAGTYTVTPTVTDSNGRTATGSPATLTVTSPSGYPTISSFSATPATLTLGASANESTYESCVSI